MEGSTRIAWPGWRSGRRAGRGAVRPIPARVTGPLRHRWKRPTRARWQAWTTAASICRWRAGRCLGRTSIPKCSTRPAGCAKAPRRLTQRFPLLAKLGSYTILAQTWLIDDKWQYQRMGLGDNGERRVPVLYGLAKAPPSLVERLRAVRVGDHSGGAASATGAAGQGPGFPLLRCALRLGRARNFQPRFRPMCTIDRKVTDKSVQDLIDHIQGNRAKRRRVPSVAEEMARAFLGLYQRALGAFEAIVEANRLYQRELSKGSPGMKSATAVSARSGLTGPVAGPAVEGQDQSPAEVPGKDRGQCE